VLDRELFEQYKADGIFKDGMIPKLENAFQAIASGVQEIIISGVKEMNTGGGTFIKN
jgi:acetylglutamate kinase